MSFKDSYRRYMERITPDSDFTESLRNDMTNPRARIRRGRIKLYIAQNVIAASLLLITMGVVSKLTSDSDSEISLPAQSVTASEISDGMFSSEPWFDGRMNSREIYTRFIELIGSESGICEAYAKDVSSASDDLSFTDSDRVAVSEIVSLADRIGHASPTVLNAEGGGRAYMVILFDGKIIKFTVFDSDCVRINDVSGDFKIEK